MMASYSLDGHRIYTANINDFPLVSGQKSYTIGPGADFDTPRPIFISAADIIFPTDPTVRYPIRIVLDEQQWMNITVQDISGAPPNVLYYDGGYDINGWAKIYLWYQPPDGYTLELATWNQLPSFSSIDDIVTLPPGYEDMMVWNFALRVEGMYPLESKLLPQARQTARETLQAVITMNAKNPALSSEAARINSRGRRGPSYGWWLGPL
jgi:hypothetical protein